MRRFTTAAVTIGLIFGLLSAAHAKPLQVITDPSGDAGLDANVIPGAEQGGFDITAGSIDTVGKDLVFTVTHSAMPSNNQPGEAVRFLWHFDVAGKQYRFTVKTLDVGKPDAIAQNGTERIGQVYQGVARLESGYTEPAPGGAPLTLSQFEALDYFDATFDAAKKTVSWKMPLSALKLKPGSAINPGTGGSTSTGCQVCWVAHYAERSLTPRTVIDGAIMAKAYKVPR